MIIFRSTLTVTLLLSGMVLGGCRPEDQRTDTLDPLGSETQAQLPPDVAAQLDSGSVAFREDRIEDARRHYQRATELGPDFAAPWFGIYMVEHRLGNAAAADSAYQRAQKAAPGATLIHPTPVDTMRSDGGPGSGSGSSAP